MDCYLTYRHWLYKCWYKCVVLVYFEIKKERYKQMFYLIFSPPHTHLFFSFPFIYLQCFCWKWDVYSLHHLFTPLFGCTENNRISVTFEIIFTVENSWIFITSLAIPNINCSLKHYMIMSNSLIKNIFFI